MIKAPHFFYPFLHAFKGGGIIHDCKDYAEMFHLSDLIQSTEGNKYLLHCFCFPETTMPYRNSPSTFLFVNSNYLIQIYFYCNQAVSKCSLPLRLKLMDSVLIGSFFYPQFFTLFLIIFEISSPSLMNIQCVIYLWIIRWSSFLFEFLNDVIWFSQFRNHFHFTLACLHTVFFSGLSNHQLLWKSFSQTISN